MTLRNIIFIIAVELFLFLIYTVLGNLSLFDPFFILGLVLPCAYLIVYLLFRYSESIVSFLKEMIDTPVKPPAFSCVRCESQRVIIHERMEQGFLHRYFWCKDCGYEWSNIALDTKETGSGEVEPRKNHVH